MQSGIQTQLSFSQHANNINAKARSKCGLLFSQLPIHNIPLNLVLDLFDSFILPIFSYGLPIWHNSCSNAAIQAINSTFTKFLKRYLQIPLHSNNSLVHFITSTVPLSVRLRTMVPNMTGSLSFPECLHGHKLSFISPHHDPPNSIELASQELLTSIPSSFWLSKTYHSIPSNKKSRRTLCRELFHSEHFKICKSSSFHPSPTVSCICIYCEGHAHLYHMRYCPILM